MFLSRFCGDPANRLSVGHRSFSNGAAVDCVETAKCRILLHELEAGWWILDVCVDISVVCISLMWALVYSFDASCESCWDAA